MHTFFIFFSIMYRSSIYKTNCKSLILYHLVKSTTVIFSPTLKYKVNYILTILNRAKNFLPLKNFNRPAEYDEVLLFWISLLVPPGVEAVGGLLEADVEAPGFEFSDIIFGDILSKGSVFTSISGGDIGGVDDKRSSLDSADAALFLPLLNSEIFFKIWDRFWGGCSESWFWGSIFRGLWTGGAASLSDMTHYTLNFTRTILRPTVLWLLLWCSPISYLAQCTRFKVRVGVVS